MFVRTITVLCVLLQGFYTAARPQGDVVNAFEVETGPVNQAVVASQTSNVTLPCCLTDSSIASARVQWWEYGSRGGGDLISDGSNLQASHPNFARYRLIVSPDQKCYNLTITQLVRADGGLYVCMDYYADPPATVQVGAQLVVMDNDPQCTSQLGAAQVALEGFTYSMECSTSFGASYPIAPLMTWNGLAPSAVQDTVSNSSVRSWFRFSANRNMDGQVMSVTTNFTSTGFGGTNVATNTPTWQNTYSFPALQVQWPPRNMYITPSEPVQEIGAVLTCNSDANPPPTYYWRAVSGPVSDSYWPGQNVTLTIEMVGVNILRCHAENTINCGTYAEDNVYNITVNPYNACVSSPCQFGGTCVRQGNGYVCNCITGITGVNCETVIDNCASKPCLNGGSCVNSVNSYLCVCHSDFTGAHCETQLYVSTASP